MRTNCPGCDALLRVPPDHDGSRMTCPKCGVRFRPPEDEEGEDDRPAPRSRYQSRRKDQSGFPVVTVIGVAAAALLAVGAVVWVIVSRPRADDPPQETAAAKKEAPKAEPRSKAGSTTATTSGPPASTPTTQNTTKSNPPATAPTTPPDGVGTPVASGTGTQTPPVVTPPKPKPKPVVVPPNPRPTSVAPTVPGEPPELVELFRTPVDAKPPTIRAASLKPEPDALPLEVPTFYSLRVARQVASGAPRPSGKLSLDDVMKATAFIRVDAGELSGSGSGFLISAANGTALVATNHHVIEAADGPRTGPGPAPKVTVVFDSGSPGERELPAAIVASDPENDLAILRVAASGKMPRPIDPLATPKLSPAMDVRIIGFPFGSQLATAGRNPNVSVNNGSISSLRLDKGGKLDKVQISGPLNPGNSGGPIVDKDGRLVGIAVATITGSGLGFAVPVDDLIALLEGRLMTASFLPTGLQGGEARFRVLVPILDPLTQVRTVYIRAWSGNGAAPKAVKDAKIGWKPIDRAAQVNLQVFDAGSSLAVAVGELKLPQSANEVVIQVASENMTGAVAASPPVAYKLNVADMMTGTDAKPLTALTADPDSQAGKVLVVRGRVAAPPFGRGKTQELIVFTTEGERPAKFRFLADRETATQFDEVDRDDQSLPVRLTCVVGRRGPDGVVPVRVARADFLGKADQIVRSIPGETKDPLAALNRDPMAFGGKSLDLTVAAVPSPARAGGAGAAPTDFMVIFPNHTRPRNLSFGVAPSLSLRLAEEKFKTNGIYKARLATEVGAAVDPAVGPTRVVVKKIEILDPKDGSVIKTIE